MNIQIRKRVAKDGTVRWSAVFEIWAQGERKVITTPGGPWETEREALRAGDREADKYENGGTAIKGRKTLSCWAEEWLQNRKGKIKVASQRHYRWRLNHWVLPHLGTTRLIDLTAVDVRHWLDNLPLSTSSKETALDALKACLNGAVESGCLTENPIKGMKVDISRSLKNQAKMKKPIKTWSHEEAEVLLAASQGHDIEAMVVMGLLCGLRPGEVQGLKWSDFDWLDGTVTVQRTRGTVPNSDDDDSETVILTDSPKSGLNRTIQMDFEAVKRMMAILEASDQDPDGVVLPQHPSWIRRRLSKLCKALQIRPLSPHSLRHTFASLAISGGASVAAVSEILGHANAHITFTTYIHAMPKDVQATTGIVARTIIPPSSDMSSPVKDPETA